jgi:hypothetical protein
MAKVIDGASFGELSGGVEPCHNDGHGSMVVALGLGHSEATSSSLGAASSAWPEECEILLLISVQL